MNPMFCGSLSTMVGREFIFLLSTLTIITQGKGEIPLVKIN